MAKPACDEMHFLRTDCAPSSICIEWQHKQACLSPQAPPALVPGDDDVQWMHELGNKLGPVGAIDQRPLWHAAVSRYLMLLWQTEGAQDCCLVAPQGKMCMLRSPQSACQCYSNTCFCVSLIGACSSATADDAPMGNEATLCMLPQQNQSTSCSDVGSQAEVNTAASSSRHSCAISVLSYALDLQSFVCCCTPCHQPLSLVMVMCSAHFHQQSLMN